MKINFKSIKDLASSKNKKIFYNRQLGGYQVLSGFNCSEVVYAFRNEKNKPELSNEDLITLRSYI